MLVVRPVQRDDLDLLVDLVTQASYGLTSLPKDRQLLEKRILDSVESFGKQVTKPGGESYLFVMEDLLNGCLAGTSGIVSKVGGFEPFYAYRIETSVHESTMLDVRKEIKVLHLEQVHSGPCEIGSLFLSPSYRQGGHGRTLSLMRFLFMAAHRQRFEAEVIAELRGVLDDQGHSPFWEAIGRHFFEIEYPTADYLSMVNKRFIADLMPTHPIYIPLLSKSAQDVIGQVHANTRGALRILKSEGFRFSGMVDIFEAGPVVACSLDEIRTVRSSVCATIGSITDEPSDSERYLISNTLTEFRACQGTVGVQGDGTVAVDKLLAMGLQVKVGDPIRYAPLRPPADGQERGHC